MTSLKGAGVRLDSLVARHLPPHECLPEIWLEHGGHLEAARELLQALHDLPQRLWQCRCGETVEGGFEQCWHCGALVPR